MHVRPPQATRYGTHSHIPKVKLVTPINEHWTSKTTNIGQMQWILRISSNQFPGIAH